MYKFWFLLAEPLVILYIYIYFHTSLPLSEVHLDALIAVWTWSPCHHCLRYWMVLTSAASSISCCCWWEVGGARVTGASTVGGIGSQSPLYLLPSYLCLHELQWLGSHSPLCYVPCCYWLLWGLGLSSYSLRAGNASTASVVCPLLPPLWCLASPSWEVQTCGILWHTGVLGRDIFVELWMFYWLWI